jgi:hypothetical protein
MSKRTKGSRTPNLRSSIYFSKADGLWHGWGHYGHEERRLTRSTPSNGQDRS